MGNSRNAILDNIVLAPEYEDYKQQRLIELVKKFYKERFKL